MSKALHFSLGSDLFWDQTYFGLLYTGLGLAGTGGQESFLMVVVGYYEIWGGRAGWGGVHHKKDGGSGGDTLEGVEEVGGQQAGEEEEVEEVEVVVSQVWESIGKYKLPHYLPVAATH